MNHNDMGTVIRADGRLGLRYERRLAHPPERVWRGLTESEHLRHWLPCDLVGDRAEGASLELPFWPAQVERYDIADPILHGEIRVWQPPVVFEWTWDTDILRWELEPVGKGTVLTLTIWLGEPDVSEGAAAGFHLCLDQLTELLDTGSVGYLEDAEVHRCEEMYAHLVAADQQASGH